MDVLGWLRDLGLEQYEAIFRENDIDASVVGRGSRNGGGGPDGRCGI